MGNIHEYLRSKIEEHKQEMERWQAMGLLMESEMMVFHCFEESEKHKASANALIGVLNFLN